MSSDGGRATVLAVVHYICGRKWKDLCHARWRQSLLENDGVGHPSKSLE